jgi:hypothetical protein
MASIRPARERSLASIGKGLKEQKETRPHKEHLIWAYSEIAANQKSSGTFIAGLHEPKPHRLSAVLAWSIRFLLSSLISPVLGLI